METKVKKAPESTQRLMEVFRKLVPFLGLILMILIFQIFGEGRLLTKGNLTSILNQTVYVGIMAFGAVFVYSHGGMDLSYGCLLYTSPSPRDA